MQQDKLKIFHFGDIQVEARPTKYGDRYDEFERALQKVVKAIIAYQPDVIVITGDLFEYHLTNPTESKLISNCLNAIKQFQIRIIPGNHDIKQKNAVITINNERKHVHDEIDSIVSTIKSANILYYRNTGFYQDGLITWAVWSQYSKFDNTLEMPYSPWELDNVPTDLRNVIELYHDPVNVCRSFDGNEQFMYKNSQGLNKFMSQLVIAGDIHSPGIYDMPNGGKFTYSSSLVARDYGEGDYYVNNHRIVSGCDKHGYNLITISFNEFGFDSEIEFVKLETEIGRSTISLDDNFLYPEMIENLRIDKHEIDHIRFNVKSKLDEFFKYEDTIYRFMRDRYNCVIETCYDANVLLSASDDDITINSISEFNTVEKITEIAHSYITNVINKTASISSEDKPAAIDRLQTMFSSELSKITLEIKKNELNIDSLTLSNFMVFGDDVHIEFNRQGTTRISGTNGVGKTMVRNALRWTLRDLAVPTLQSNKKFENRLYCFNDHRSKDTVDSRIEFRFNGIPHVLTKQLIRRWKHNKNMYDQKNWRDYVAAIPELIMTLEMPDETLTDHEQIFAYMNNVISDSEFDTLISIDRKTIENLLHQDANDLNASILRNIGLNFFDTMADNAKTAISEMLMTMTNPGDWTIEKLIERIQNVNTDKEQAVSLIESSKLEYESFDKEKHEKQIEITELTKKLHNIGTVDEVKLKRDLKDGELTNVTTLKTSVESEKLALENMKVTASLDEAYAKFNTCSESHTNAVNDLNNLNQSIATERNAVQSKTELFKAVVTIESNKVSNSILEIETKVQTVNNAISDNNSKINELHTKISSVKQTNLDKLNQQYLELVENTNTKNTEYQSVNHEHQSNQFKINSLDSDITRLNQEIEDLIHAKTCPTCSRLLEPEQLQVITENIEKKQLLYVNVCKDRDALVLTVSDLNSKKIQLGISVHEMIDEQSKLKSVIANYTVPISEISEELSEIERLNLSNLEHAKTIALHKSEIDKLGATRKDTVLSSASVIEAKRILDEHSAKLTELESLVGTKESIVSNTLLEKVSSETYLNSIKTIDKQIAGKQEQINQLNTKFQLLNQERDQINIDLIFAYNDIQVNADILAVNNTISQITAKIEDNIRNRANLNNRLLNGDKIISESEQLILDCKAWNLASSVGRQYQAMLSKKGLPQYVFAKITDLLNMSLNELLNPLKFRLIFDSESSNLQFVDLEQKTIRPVTFVSGMQTMMSGLALIHTRSKLNQTKRVNLMIVDEISGVLNDGKELSYAAENYKQLMAELLQVISKTTPIYIIDHVIEDLNEQHILEVQPSSEGAIIKELRVS